MKHMVLTGELAEKMFELLEERQEFKCPQMPSMRALVLWRQAKFDEFGNLIELQIRIVG